MRVWIDACTGKHVRYACAISKRLRSLGHQLILTIRKHPNTLALAKMLGEKFTVVGKYDPTSLSTRLEESVKRQLMFCKMLSKNIPDLAISHPSVELCRVAFGLGIPIFSTADSPHAKAVNKLTLPLTDVLIASKAIPQHRFQSYGIVKIIQFDGVDEVAWIKDYKPKLRAEYEKPLIVVRQMETRASYMRGKVDVTEKIASELTTLGQVIFLSRYNRQPRKGLIVPKKYVDSVSLVAEADLVVTAGGTLAREAALQGTPTIVIPVIKDIDVNKYISNLGFPLFIVDLPDLLKYAKKYVGIKWDVKEKLEKLENPVDIIERTIKEEMK